MDAGSCRPSVPRRVLRGVGVGVCAFLALLVLGLGSALVYVESASGRRFVVTKVNQALAPTFQGRLEIASPGSVGVFGLVGGGATLFDPSGRPVLTARGVRARIATWALVRSALFGRGGPLVIALSDVSIDDVDVRLDTDPSGQLDLVDAFTPKPSSPSGPSRSRARGVRVDIARIVMKHAWARGVIAGAPPLDADVDHLTGSFSYAPDRWQGEVTRANIVARGLANGADVAGTLEGHVESPNELLAGLAGHAVWRGTAGTLAHSLEVSIDKSKLTVLMDAPSFDPKGVRSLWPESTIESSGSLHVEARGVPPAIDVDLRASLGQATFSAKGNVVVADDKKATLSIAAHDIDIHQFARAAPASRLSLTGSLSGSRSADGVIHLAATLRFLGGTVGVQDLPPATIQATGAGSTSRDLRAHADALVDEPTAPSHVVLDLAPKGTSFVLDAALESNVADLERVPELKHGVRGIVQVAAKGTLDLGSMSVDAHLNAAAANMAQGATSLASASASVHAWGPLARLSLEAAVRGHGLVAAGRHVATFEVAATGAETTPHVTLSAQGPDIPTTDASANIDLGQGVTLRSLRVGLARAGERAVVSADSIRVSGGAVRVEGARIEGLGWPATGSFEQTGQALHVRASSQGIDLGRMGRLVGIEGTLSGGTLSLDTNINAASGRVRGNGIVDFADVSMAGMRDLSGHIEVAVDGRRIKGSAHAQAQGFGSIDLDAPNLDLGGDDLLSLSSWQQAWGEVSFDTTCDLARALGLLASDPRPFGEARGHVTLKGTIGRANPSTHDLNLKFSFKTDGLALAPNTPRSREIDGVMVVGAPAWHLEEIDFDGDAALNGRTGLIDFETQIRDRKGELGTVHVTLPRFPYKDFLYDTVRLGEDARTSPFDIRAAVAERELDGLPDILKQAAVTGRITADAHVTGTLLVPRVDLAVTLRDSHFPGEAQSLSGDLHFAAHYDGKRGTASITAGSGNHPIVDASATFDAEFAQVLDPSESLAWSASGRAHFADFPLGAIPALDAKLVSGNLSGNLVLVDLHKNAQATADLVVEALRVGSVDCKSVRAHAKTDTEGFDAAVHVDQTDGFVDVKARAVAKWGAAIAPVLDPKQPIDVRMVSRNFRIAALLPLLSPWLDELDGRVDADMRGSFEPSTGGATLSGTLGLSRGLIEASAGGGELHDVSASVRFNPNGTVVVDRLSASGLTGRLQASASGRFDGTRFQSAKAILTIPSRLAIPLTADGTEIGNIDGRVELSATAPGDGRAMTLAVQIPHLRVVLPEGTSSDVQALGGMTNVHIGAHKGSRTTLRLVPLDPKRPSVADASVSRTEIAVSIADIQVERGTDLKVDLSGTLHVESGPKTRVTGQIELRKGGALNVEGKEFEVESGTVTFTGGDAANPEVVVRADWTAPDGTVVSANFVGPLKTGKVTLSSEPTLPQQEIVELVLYGTATGQQAQSPSNTAENTAIATAGGQAAQPLNHALNQVGLGVVTAKIDTSAASTPKPEVEVQIARGVSIQIAYVLGLPPPGVNPDTTLLSVDWRFLSKWSLESTVGDAGTTILDLLWQTRY
jgi:translocation and assembly module TamB